MYKHKYDLEEEENVQHEHKTRGSQEPVIAHLVFNFTSKTPKQSISYDFVAVTLARITF
jgi:hypothetical protein